MVRLENYDKIEFYSRYRARTLGTSIVEDLLTHYLKAIKQNRTVYLCIMASVKVSWQIPRSEADANRILNFINSDRETTPILIKAYLFSPKMVMTIKLKKLVEKIQELKENGLEKASKMQMTMRLTLKKAMIIFF